MKKSFTTSFPFPMIKLNTLINYSEVKKPSGISYIILVLINESESKEDNISHLLKQFGVPGDLHDIFAREIEKLLELEIIKLSQQGEYNRRFFEDYKVGDFKFTPKGKKIFAEEAIPTDKNLEKKQVLWFDPVSNELKVSLTKKAGQIGPSILSEEFCDQFKYLDIDELELYIDVKKGEGIPIKKDDIITKADIQSQEYMFVTYPIELSIDNSSVIEVNFEEKKRIEFFRKYYNATYLTKALGFKNKFKFKNYTPTKIDIKEISNISNILLPEEIENYTNKKAFLAVTKDHFTFPNANYSFKDTDVFADFMQNVEFIIVEKNKKAKAYLPGLATLVEKNFEQEVYVNILIEKELTISELSDIVTTIISNNLSEYSRENVQIIANLVTLLSDDQLLYDMLNSYLSDNIETNVIHLKEMTNVLSNMKEHKEFIQRKAKYYYNEYYNNISIDDIQHRYSIGSWLAQVIKVNDIDFIKQLLPSFPKGNEQKLVNVYTLFEELNFSTDDLLVFMNVADIFLMKTVNNQEFNYTQNKIAIKFGNLQTAFNDLKLITGVKNLSNVKLNQNINQDEFQKIFKQFANTYNEIKKYQKYSPESFKEISNYYDLFSKLNDLFNEERNALLKPDKITRKFIEDKLLNGDYSGAIIRLSVKSEELLKSRLNIDSSLNDLINAAHKENFINKKQAKQFHELRETRNKVVHFVGQSLEVKKCDIETWTDLVYELEGS